MSYPDATLSGVEDHEHLAGLPDLSPMLPLADGRVLPGFDVTGLHALRWWQQLSAVAPRTGRWPLLTNDDTRWRLTEGDCEYTPDVWLAQAATLDGAQVLAESAPHRPWLRPTYEEAVAAERAGTGTWPDSPPRVALSDIVTTPWGDLTWGLVLVPAEHSWQIPCVLGDRLSEVPGPAEHAAVLRYWHQRYGAQMLADTGDGTRIAVARPPTTRLDALELAWQYECFNDGSYDFYQADGVVDVAASLVGADVWCAWWD